jgi:transposase
MSWDLARGEDFLPDFSLNELKQKASAENNRQPRLRLLVALNRKDGKSIDQIADAVGLHRRSVQDILHRFEERGLRAAHSLPKPGRTPHLARKQLQDLRKHLLCSPKESGFVEGFWNSRMIRKLVRKKYGVKYCKSNVPKLMSKIGFSYKKPRATNPRRASPEEIAEFKKKRAERYWLPNARKEQSL